MVAGSKYKLVAGLAPCMREGGAGFYAYARQEWTGGGWVWGWSSETTPGGRWGRRLTGKGEGEAGGGCCRWRWGTGQLQEEEEGRSSNSLGATGEAEAARRAAGESLL